MGKRVEDCKNVCRKFGVISNIPSNDTCNYVFAIFLTNISSFLPFASLLTHVLISFQSEKYDYLGTLCYKILSVEHSEYKRR